MSDLVNVQHAIGIVDDPNAQSAGRHHSPQAPPTSWTFPSVTIRKMGVSFINHVSLSIFKFRFIVYALNKESPCSLFSAAFLTCGIHSFMSSFFAIASLLSINNHKVVDKIATDPIHPVYSTIVSSQYGIVLPLFSYRSASIYKTRAP